MPPRRAADVSLSSRCAAPAGPRQPESQGVEGLLLDWRRLGPAMLHRHGRGIVNDKHQPGAVEQRAPDALIFTQASYSSGTRSAGQTFAHGAKPLTTPHERYSGQSQFEWWRRLSRRLENPRVSSDRRSPISSPSASSIAPCSTISGCAAGLISARWGGASRTP